MKNLALCASLLAAAAASFATGCTTDEEGPADATLTVVNQSNFAIVELYLTADNARGWGANYLSGDVMYPGDELVLEVDCGYYDALLIDDDNVRCELESINLCLNDATWYIRDNTCVAFEAALQARKQAAEAAKAPPTGSTAQ
jgi:hypothetical protein